MKALEKKGNSRLLLPNHIVNLVFELLALLLQLLHCLQEQLVAVPLPRALDGEDEVVPPSSQLHLALELFVSQTLPADCVSHRVDDDGLEFSSVTLVAAAPLPRLLLRDLLQPDDAFGEALGELLRVSADDGFRDLDRRHQAV